LNACFAHAIAPGDPDSLVISSIVDPARCERYVASACGGGAIGAASPSRFAAAAFTRRPLPSSSA